MADWQGFYKLDWAARVERVSAQLGLSAEQRELIEKHYDAIGEQQVENYLYNFGVPMGLVTELPVDGRLVNVPMATEEPSVIAAANNGARMMRTGQGVVTKMQRRLIRGQVVVTDLTDVQAFVTLIQRRRDELLHIANAARPSMQDRGGGAKEIKLEILDQSRVIVNVMVDPKEAMGANVVNTMAEAVANYLREHDYHVLMAVLSNYATEALVSARVEIPVAGLATKQGIDGALVAQRIVAANEIEYLSPYRAVTSNKGIMNGIEAVVLASGNDVRAINASVHAYAGRDDQYHGLARWTLENETLVGGIELPLALGTVGGSIGIVPAVQLNQTLMGNPSVKELGGIVAAIGLAQNLAALRALVSTGIQKGHMALQARSLAIAAGALLTEVDEVVGALQASEEYTLKAAQTILHTIRNGEQH